MVINRQRRVRVAVQPLEDFLERVRRELRFPERGVTVQLLSDMAIARLNRRFRNKRGPTDVLSFPAKAGGSVARNNAARARFASYMGDIAISPETARRNARRDARAMPTELRLLLLHGMIHLAGYDHETDQGQMTKLETALRRKLGLSSKR
jgi:probable rRNA maturation factor